MVSPETSRCISLTPSDLNFRPVDASRKAECDKTFFRFYPKAVGMQIWQKTAACAVFRVGYIVTAHRALSGNLTNSGHVLAPHSFFDTEPHIISKNSDLSNVFLQKSYK